MLLHAINLYTGFSFGGIRAFKQLDHITNKLTSHKILNDGLKISNDNITTHYKVVTQDPFKAWGIAGMFYLGTYHHINTLRIPLFISAELYAGSQNLNHTHFQGSIFYGAKLMGGASIFDIVQMSLGCGIDLSHQCFLHDKYPIKTQAANRSLDLYLKLFDTAQAKKTVPAFLGSFILSRCVKKAISVRFEAQYVFSRHVSSPNAAIHFSNTRLMENNAPLQTEGQFKFGQIRFFLSVSFNFERNIQLQCPF